MDWMQAITWSLSAISMVGAILNVKKRPSSFAFWVVSNWGWVLVSAYRNDWAQASMWVLYGCISAWGLCSWRKSPAAKAPVAASSCTAS